MKGWPRIGIREEFLQVAQSRSSGNKGNDDGSGVGVIGLDLNPGSPAIGADAFPLGHRSNVLRKV